MQVCKCEDFLQLGEEDVREMLRDEEVTPHCCCCRHEYTHSPPSHLRCALAVQCAVKDERHVLEAVTRWMKAGEEEGGVRGEDLLTEVCVQ